MATRGLTAYSAPVGGPAAPPIPRLDLPAAVGPTMAEQAAAQRSPPPGAVPSSFFQAPSVNTSAPPARQGPPPAQLLPSDTLPEQAKKDPEYREGMGSMYASSNPALAYKYGVIRSGKHVPPQQLQGRPSGGGLSQATVEGLKVVEEFTKTRERAESVDPSIEADAASGHAGAAARLGQTATTEKPLTPEERSRIQNTMDDFDFHTLREMLMKDILNNEEQRKLVESRLQTMDVTNYVMNGFVEQEVPINNNLRFTFRSVSGETDLALKRLVVKEMKGFAADDRYILDKYAVMSMSCVLSRVNGSPLPDYLDAKGDFDEGKFWEKFNKVSKMGLHVLASIGVNSFWFDIRVRKLVVADNLKNG